MKPAPPVIRILTGLPLSGAHGATPHREVREAERLHLRGLVDVSAVEDHRLLEESLHALEIGPPELVPLRDQHERVGSLERVVVDLVIADAVAEQLPRLAHRLGVCLLY